MPFLTAFMLIGSLAAAIPIAIHLFFRSRYRTVPWAAMKFLLTSVEQTSRRLKFQEYALLLIRCAVLVFLAMALARPINLTGFGALYLILGAMLAIVTVTWALSPFWQATGIRRANWIIYGVTQVVLILLCIGAWFGFSAFNVGAGSVKSRGQGDAVDAVLVIDASFSMGAQDGAKTRLQRAQDEAIKVIDELPPHSTVQIITCAGKTPTLLGPRSPANLDQARQIVQEKIEIAHLSTDLAVGVVEAKRVLAASTASNKELYVFTDMQKSGFDQQAGVLKATLEEIKEKAIVHFVRCGTRSIKNVAIVDITPQTRLPRPGEKVSFGVRVENTSNEPIDGLRVALLVDGEPSDEQKVPKLGGKSSYTVGVRGELKEAGLRVLTAKVSHDELEGDNRLDQVILVRKQVNILIVDGKPEKDPVNARNASSFFAAHALALARHNPRIVPARLAAPPTLDNQDICILINCALETKIGVDGLHVSFLEKLESFVREGHGLIVFSGENVDPVSYNEKLGKKLGLLPMPLLPIVKAAKPGLKDNEKKPFLVDRQSFRFGPPAFWLFKDDERYFRDFDKVEVWQHFGLDETARKEREKKDLMHADPDKKDKTKDAKDKEKSKEEHAVSVVLRTNQGLPLVVAQRIDAGEVLFVTTAAHDEGIDPKTQNPSWTDLGSAPEFPAFMDVSINHLLRGQTQTYNLVAGQALRWFATDKLDHAYYLVHPDGKRIDRLGVPVKEGVRHVVTASDLPRAGIYRMTSKPRDAESTTTIDPLEAARTGMPIAVIPDLSESADLSTLSEKEINPLLGFTPIHIVAGQPAAASSGADRLNREWTTWALLFVFALVLVEVAFAWWCGRGW